MEIEFYRTTVYENGYAAGCPATPTVVAWHPPTRLTAGALVCEIDEADWNYLARFHAKYEHPAMGGAGACYEFYAADVKEFFPDDD